MTPETPDNSGQPTASSVSSPPLVSDSPEQESSSARLAAHAAGSSRIGVERRGVSAFFTLSRHVGAWAVLLLLLLALLGALAGCGIGPSSFTGGGVPIGGSRLYGRVVAAADPMTSLSGVDVKIDATPMGGISKRLEMTTGKDGTFNFSNVLPGFSNGTVAVTATPDNSAYRAQQVMFQVSNGHTEQMIVTLPPASFDTTTAKSLFLSLPSPAIPSGETVRFQAEVRDDQGKPLPVTPTLVFDGNFGTLNADATLTVPQGVLSGMGTVTAYWYSLPPKSTPVRVDNTGSSQPPPAPILPTTTDGNAGQ